MSSRADGRSESPGVLLSASCRPLRRSLRPAVWVVLEEVALDAELLDDGRLVARTSARQVAEQLGVNPTTTAEALRVLGRRGLISLEREKGRDGRFGLSAYRILPPAGLMVVQPCMAEPHAVTPSMAQPDTAAALVSSACAAAPQVESSRLEAAAPGAPVNPADEVDLHPTSAAPIRDSSGTILGEGSTRRRDRSTPSPGSSRACPGQTALDLGLGSS
jgi:DNA-binding transcriptional ArsR family regulator